MQKEDLYRWMDNPDNLDTSTLEELKRVVEKYPYFHAARLLFTKNLNLTDHQDYGEELGRTAVLCNDRRKLFYLICREEYAKLLDQGEAACPKEMDRTEELLESFLSSFGEKEMIEPVIENLTYNLAATDYFSFLHAQEEKTEVAITEQTENQKLQHHDIIDAFIEKAESDVLFVPQDTPPADSKQKEEISEDEGGEFLTETLARIYIKQKKYEQALTIIQRLSLNFPKKSAYFAHQIRFLELLIMNERFR